jgi:hypothetical protein
MMPTGLDLAFFAVDYYDAFFADPSGKPATMPRTRPAANPVSHWLQL